jgi:hypothetical protein
MRFREVRCVRHVRLGSPRTPLLPYKTRAPYKGKLAVQPFQSANLAPTTGNKVSEALGGSGGTNPARRFWTRLLVVLRPDSNSSAIVSPFYLAGADQALKIGVRFCFLHLRGR